MATNNAGTGETPTSTSTTSTDNSSTDETQGTEQQGQQQPTGETPGQEQQQPSNNEKPVTLPDDHPLVKTLAANKEKIASQSAELTELRAKSAKVTQLEDELKQRPTAEALATLQNRQDRLEAFLTAVGGPLSKALDSKSFTTALFETDKDIKDIVKEFNAANPSATSAALGAGAAAPAKNGPSINDLLRAGSK